MRRILVFVVVLACVLSSLSATYEFGTTGLSFTWAPIDPLFKESRAYQYNNNVAFRYLMAPADTKYLATDILVADGTANGEQGGYKRLSFKEPNTGNNAYWNLKAAINTGLFRFSWHNYLQLELYLHGGLNTIFGAYGGVDVLGFDGFYGAGASLSVFDIVTLRFGFHHFSGHWGDETMNDFYSRLNRSAGSASLPRWSCHSMSAGSAQRPMSLPTQSRIRPKRVPMPTSRCPTTSTVRKGL